MSNKLKRKIDQNRSLFFEKRIEHLIKRAKERYQVSFSKKDILKINFFIKNAFKGRMGKGHSFYIKNVYEKTHTRIYLFLYQDNFYRVTWDIKLSQIITFLPLYIDINYHINKGAEPTTIEKLKQNNIEIKFFIDKYFEDVNIEHIHKQIKNINTNLETEMSFEEIKKQCQIIK